MYLGTSRTRRGFDPAVFDAELRRQGVRVRSFNLGVPGLRGFAQEEVVRRLLAGDTSRLRLLILAPDELETALTPDASRDDRLVLWHDLERTVDAIQAVAQSPAGIVDKARWAWSHVNSYLLRLSVSGRLASRFAYRTDTPEWRLLGPAGDGYFPYPVRDIPADDYADRAAAVAAAQESPAPSPTDAEREYVASIVERVRAHGVDVVFVREPLLQVNRSRFLAWLAANDPSAPVVDLGDASAHPELFAPELYHDPRHLNSDGAVVYSRALARELLPVLRAES